MKSPSYVFVLQVWTMGGPCAMLSAHSILLEFSIMLALNHSLQQNEEQDLLWLQPNSCFHGRAGLHVSPVVICILKRAANYIAAALTSFCCLRISKHRDTCDELAVPEIQEQARLAPPWRHNDLPSPKQPSATFTTWGRCIFHLRLQQEDFAKMTLLKSWSRLLVLKYFS